MTHHKSVLVACDIRYASDRLGKMWVDLLVAELVSHGWAVHVLTREVDGIERHQDLSRAGGLVVSESDVPPEHQDAEGHLARYRARSVIARAEELGYDLVLVQGLSLCRYVAGSGRLGHSLWTVPLDRPYAGGSFSPADFSDLRIVSRASSRILVADEVQRSVLDAEFTEASSKVRLLPLFGRTDRSAEGESTTGLSNPPESPEVRVLHDSDTLTDIEALHVREGLFGAADAPALDAFGARLRSARSIPRILVHGTEAGTAESGGEHLRRSVWGLPGAVDGQRFAAGGWELLPADPPARHYGQLLAEMESRPCASLVPVNSTTAADTDPFAEADIAPVDRAGVRPVRLVIAGSDFKFAGDLVESFLADPGFDVRFDVFAHHSRAQPKASEPYLEWAEVVLTEFAVQNAIWYSHNLAPHQRLIVHLHGFELLADWIEDLDIDRVSTIVVASEFYRQQAHDMRRWPLEKIKVIPNSVNPFDLVRPKLDDARFHLGLVGMVPILKRPDRALDLLEQLTAVDPRYTLHIRGHAPWNYSWEWKKAAHQDAYREFYRRLGERPELLGSVSFEPFAPDMANWLRKIGWLLSPSSRETFHLAAIEGAMSGAVPLAWERDGAREIIGPDWTFASTEEIRDFVLSHNGSPDEHALVSARARSQVDRYRSDTVGRLWRQTVVEVRAGSSQEAPTGMPRGAAGEVYREVDALVAAGEFDEAKGALDRHIEVTKNDSSELKVLEMFVRGLLALDSRRTELIPTPDPGSVKAGAASATFVQITVLDPGSETGGPTADPSVLDGVVGVVPFGYTGDARANGTGAEHRAAEPARTARMFSGAVVTDPLEDHLDVRITVSDRLRFDRWVEVVASELRQHLSSFPSARLLVDGPWHIALPAAVAAGRIGVPFVWAPPVAEIRTSLAEVADQPYTGDVIAQFAGLLASRAIAVIVPPDHRPCLGTSERVPRTPNIVEAPVDARAIAHIDDLIAFPGSPRTLGALNTAKRVRSGSSGQRRLRLALVGSRAFVERFRAHDSVLDSVVLVSPQDVDPSCDALIVDSSAESEPDAVPGAGTCAQRVRTLFDLARSSGVLGIFNAATLVGGDTITTAMAEKADAITGTRAVLASALLARNPNSITRVGSQSLDDTDSTRVLAALAAVGVGPHPRTDPSAADGAQESDLLGAGRRRPSAEHLDLSGLRMPETDGVSLVLATRLGAHRVQHMLASIAAQSIHPSRLELLVVHNGPEDGTAEVVEAFAEANPLLSTHFVHSDVEGASEARNLGLRMASRDFVTFIDDDDEIERNYVLNMWLSADEGVVVAAPLRDVAPDGSSRTDIPNNRRLANLAGRRSELHRVSGLLGLNACKLIPTRVAQEMSYPAGLRSGEDVAFMSQLLLHELCLVPAAAAPESAYIRHLRPDSVSRRELSRDFAVNERLEVIACLETVRLQGAKRIEGCVRALQNDQLSFVARYVSENPAEGEDVIARVLASGVSMSQLQGRYANLHALARTADGARV